MSRVIRIQGLVRTAQNLRVRIGRGMTEPEKTTLRRNADKAIADVDRILQSHGARPEHLAAPSRKAYRFIKQIQWDQIGPPSDDSPDHPAAVVRWTGLGTLLDRLAMRLGANPGQTELNTIAQTIANMSGQIEGTIRRENLSPAQLTPATRGLRAWFAFLAQQENLAQYQNAVLRADAELRRAGVVPPGSPEKLIIEFRPTRHIYKMTRYADGRRIIMPTAMISFDSAQLADLAALVARIDRHAKRRVEEHMQSEACSDLTEELDGLGGVVEITRGARHDLAASFDRVNARYFAGAMARPRLSWSAGFTSRKFGHYNFSQDWLMLSSTLDQRLVPEFVVDFVMYHELLHKKHGLRWRNGRGYAHTADFYFDERQFERHAEAEQFIQKLARA